MNKQESLAPGDEHARPSLRDLSPQTFSGPRSRQTAYGGLVPDAFIWSGGTAMADVFDAQLLHAGERLRRALGA
jgi:hypothetical protein